MEEIGDELVIKVDKIKERTNFLNKGGGFPVMNDRDFNRVHFNLFLTNDHAEKLSLRSIKDTFY